MYRTEMTFFERFEADILSGQKTITIRDESENNYQANSIVQVSTYEDNRWFCALKIDSVTPIQFSELNDFHATQENMTLAQLKSVIRDIYPDTEELYVIAYSLVNES
ncbi:N(4)-acetylcytidine aminohydrolase [Thalassotalea maritima]|uniref:N(4)-acetylcytidine aminohydrolase n=1 Tax=Thalassotalea maritima TaxID=3242416 RepID=UPI00352820CB